MLLNLFGLFLQTVTSSRRRAAPAPREHRVHTNVIFWNPSSAGLRNVGGSQKSSVAYVQCINTVCSYPDNICCGTQPNYHKYKCWETALLMSCAVGVPLLCSRSYKHGPTANQDVLSHSQMIPLLWLRSLFSLCSLLKRSLWFY